VQVRYALRSPYSMSLFENINISVREPHGRLAIATFVGMVLLVSPMLSPFVIWIYSVIAAFMVAVPYTFVLWRCMRKRERSGPALAMGISLVIGGVAVILILLSTHHFRDLVLWSVLLACHAGMCVLALIAFRAGSSEKPVWRLLVRGFVDPIVYYGFVFFVFAAAVGHL
jgi:hypothetical protein